MAHGGDLAVLDLRIGSLGLFFRLDRARGPGGYPARGVRPSHASRVIVVVATSRNVALYVVFIYGPRPGP